MHLGHDAATTTDTNTHVLFRNFSKNFFAWRIQDEELLQNTKQ